MSIGPGLTVESLPGFCKQRNAYSSAEFLDNSRLILSAQLFAVVNIACCSRLQDLEG